ncbi:isoleucine--tRNA ligase [Akkermansiaceae bacterium]|nr:isoleucine--tRNA ligase [Akkermansiaceae bacterium]MDB4296967.1 isoleucine--tRNA ligase [Akkermansiaceae bacterium]MDB4321707.1 isoleucine--tRNA ligase [Akkermansiaceae bacterium]MDB4619854.1 isoleucine--tRNA ligase [Akkermansiaceae bacterium]MDB4692725.1 isoleucine--tRNA ligase [Akkermansiaceae bacterium]
MSTPEGKSYKDTLFLPKTDFPMKGNLTVREPARLEKWNSEGLYARIIAKRKAEGAPRFLLHDGPPFANGDVHMGTGLNKVLKDFVIKSKTMAGFEAPYIPGWDCHGLPIEFKVMQDEDARDVEPAEIRRRCETFARGWIDTQRESFKRLGVFGDWENPYLTLNPDYEANIIRTFAALIDKGCVYQSQKPVQWSYGAKTALAEAEVEYADKKSTAVFVPFAMTGEKWAGFDIAIWTTTPWTLPANLGIAVNERFVYVAGEFTNGEATRKLIVARELLGTVEEKTGWTPSSDLQEIKGAELENLDAQHPFLDRTSKILLANFVTAESGTGAVHIAPGHGADDYTVGQQYGLAVLSPVDDDGKFTEECGVPELVGQHVFKANARVVEILEEKGSLLGQETYAHSYPHCWRSKTPIIFRAVEQFFISIDKLRDKALSEIDETEWLPKWGRNRIYGTVESRPDWCISRQRTWGVPLPVFFTAEGEPIVSADLARKIADLVEKEGTNVWFEKSDEELATLFDLPAGSTKCRDTLDVWIDSGSSHVAVLDAHPELSCPADLYLEATDQHRGWFQSSLMLSVGVRDKAPYKTVLTHGFVVDTETGKKTSKSDAKKKGKPTDAAHFYNKYGSDILRLWVSSVDWQSEVPFSEALFTQVSQPYRQLRNTFKILLGNMRDEKVSEPAELPLIDQWIMERLQVVITEVREAYEKYDFRKVFSTVNQFAASDLSACYIDITKDRLYCDAENSEARKASVWVMGEIFDAMVKLLAPVLAYTAEEAWEHAGGEGSIHEQDFPKVNAKFANGEAIAKVDALFAVKAVIQTAIEEKVQAKEFKKNNEASVLLTVPANHQVIDLLKDSEFAKEFFILSDLNLVEGAEISATVSATGHPMCPRCRKYEPVVKDDLCQRCSDAV